MAVVTTGVCISLVSCIAACLQCCWRPCLVGVTAVAGVLTIAYAPASAGIISVPESPTVDAPSLLLAFHLLLSFLLLLYGVPAIVGLSTFLSTTSLAGVNILLLAWSTVYWSP
jgi:hypothetical protein